MLRYAPIFKSMPISSIIPQDRLERLEFSNDEIAFYDVGVGFWAYLVGIFVGGILYARLGMKRSVLISLILMAVSNLSFAALAMAGHTNVGMAAAVLCFEAARQHRAMVRT